MKFAIISDTHDNMRNIEKALNWIQKEDIQVILHCGDITMRRTMYETAQRFGGTIYYVRGNGDYELEDIPEKLELELSGKKIFFNHYPDVARKAAESGKYDLVFHGHTHKPWVEQVGSPSTGSGRACWLANPGELAGQRFKPTFAVYNADTDKLELKILEKL